MTAEQMAGPPRPKNLRKHFCLTPADRAAIGHLARLYQFNGAQVVRFALRQQVLRDEAEARDPAARAKNQPLYDRIRESATDYYLKSQLYGAGEAALRIWGLWMDEESQSGIVRIQDHWGMPKQADAVRFALRVQAELDGFRPEGGVW